MVAVSSSSRRFLEGFALLASVAGVLSVVACSPPAAQPISSPPKPPATPTAAPVVSAGAVAARPVCPVDAEPAAPAPTGKKAVSISIGWERACAVLEDGRVMCWGGQWPRLPPTVIGGVDEAVQVAVVGHTHDAFVVRKDGALLRVPRDGAVTKVAGLGEVVEVAAGVNVIAARAKDGTVQVTEAMPGAAKLTWQKLPAKGVKQVAAGGHVCVLDTAEKVSCFTVDGKSIKPYSIPALGTVKRIASGGAAACATLADGTNRCFEVGQGPSFKPIDLPAGRLAGVASIDWNDGPVACVDTKEGLPKVVAADSCWGQACLIDTCGAVRCWGTNWAGQAGAGGVVARAEPKPVDL